MMSRNRYEAGVFNSSDQFVVSALGCLLSGLGRGDSCDKFRGGQSSRMTQLASYVLSFRFLWVMMKQLWLRSSSKNCSGR